MNLVVVSNRVARAKANEPMTGGLAAALLPVVEKSGAIWVGSSGRVRDGAQKDPFPQIESLGAGAIAMLDLPAAHYGGYYEGFANSALWPALHSRPDLIRVSNEDYKSYREVNAFMARALLRFRKPDTAFWIQDYHFLALGAELRELNVRQPIGFFLHTPWPASSVINGVPNHRELIGAMLAYDLIGFQTEDDCENFAEYLRSELGLEVEDGVVTSSYGTSRLAAFPIGIDVDAFAQHAARAASHPDVSRLRMSLHGEKLAIGVDRVDYSKGLVNRISAFDRLFTAQPQLKRAVSLLQIATPSRWKYLFLCLARGQRRVSDRERNLSARGARIGDRAVLCDRHRHRWRRRPGAVRRVDRQRIAHQCVRGLCLGSGFDANSVCGGLAVLHRRRTPAAGIDRAAACGRGAGLNENGLDATESAGHRTGGSGPPDRDDHCSVAGGVCVAAGCRRHAA